MGFGNWIEDYVNRIGESGLASEASGTSNIARQVANDNVNQNVSDEQSSSDEVMESKENDGVSPTAEESNRNKIRNLNKTFSDTEVDDDFFKLGDKQNRKMWEEQFVKDIGDKYSPERAFGMGDITLSRDWEKANKKYEETGDIDDLYSAMRMAEEVVARKGSTTNRAAKKDADTWTARYNEARSKFDKAERNEGYMDTINSNGDYLTKYGAATASLRDAMENFIKNPTSENLRRYESEYKTWQPLNTSMSYDLVEAIIHYNDGDYYNKYKDSHTIGDDLSSRFQAAHDKFIASSKTKASPAKTTSETVKEAAKKTTGSVKNEPVPSDELAADLAMKAETEDETKAETEDETKAVKRNKTPDIVTPKDFDEDLISTPKADNDAKASSGNNWSNKGSNYVDNLINKYRKKFGDNAFGNYVALRKLMSPKGFYAMAKDGFAGFKEFAKKVDAGDVSDEELAQLYDFLTKDENSEDLFVSAERFYDKNLSNSSNTPIEKIESDTSKRTDDTEYNLGLKREDEKSKVASDEKVKSFFKTLLKFDPVVRKVGRI